MAEEEEYKTIAELNNDRKKKKKQILTEEGKKKKQENIKKAQIKRKENIEKRKTEYKAQTINNKLKNIVSDEWESIKWDDYDEKSINNDNDNDNYDDKNFIDDWQLYNKKSKKQNIIDNNKLDRQIEYNNFQTLAKQFDLFSKNLEKVNNRVEKLYTMKKTKQNYKWSNNNPIIVNKIDKKTLSNEDKLMNEVRTKILSSGN